MTLQILIDKEKTILSKNTLLAYAVTAKQLIKLTYGKAFNVFTMECKWETDSGGDGMLLGT
jgi:hypothetical protein